MNLCYQPLVHTVFSDKMIASTVYRRVNRCAPLHIADFGLARGFPMASRCEAHETLSLLFAQDNNARAMIQGNFYQNLKCQLKQLEACTSWEKEKLKRSKRKLLKSRAPKHLWDNCLELETYIRSNTVNNN